MSLSLFFEEYTRLSPPSLPAALTHRPTMGVDTTGSGER
jgi:hypothetical protein